MLDLQQRHTTLIDHTRISQRVQATVISYYPGRGENGVDEALVDAGAIAFSKDSGPSGGYGEVVGLPWKLSRISQEHGILTPSDTNTLPLKLGTVVSIVGQHACLIAAVSCLGIIVSSRQRLINTINTIRLIPGTISSIVVLKEAEKWSTSGFLGKDGKLPFPNESNLQNVKCKCCTCRCTSELSSKCCL